MTATDPWETDWQLARAALEWQVEMGADDAICDAPLCRYDLPEKRETAQAAASAPAAGPVSTPVAVGPEPLADPVAIATQAAESAPDLDALQDALAAFDHCDLKLGARNLVFADGQRNARVMIIGEAPGREEDRQGRPFVGEAGQLLDRMFAAIDMGRENPDPAHALYITNILPWRPPQNRDPSAEERAMMRPFVQRHIELIDPEFVILMGRISAGTMLNTTEGITRLRGQWCDLVGRPCLPMLHPAYLLRNPAMKRHAWADLLSLQAKLRT
ncbi:uracil-DNA glycosylase [Roseinatronobacter alkalisoli]|uniref:Type-4 uracil-DNA glycosylase n=1 Tax=Roseinatronobacter alkalisoli TaxID=3028235 RepID=A0ABT5TBC4_9RHOB|nr:uracil-DNA glycosylase [Roseinatronobacter sp. HJB301]MDD7972384.1 uracil-DNA glycosylase [Roseinatronobacter sp. HJB301]